MRPSVNRSVLCGAAVVSALMFADPSAAHDLRIVPDASQAVAGTSFRVRTVTRNKWWMTFASQSSRVGGRRTSDVPPVTGASDSTEAVATVAAFHGALARGDSAAVLSILAPDVVIMEAGGIETLAEYRSHHLSGDIAYARAIPGVHSIKAVVVQGDVAWVSSTSIAEGQFNGRAVNSVGAELVILSRQRADTTWVIRAVHWSSRRRTP